MLYDGVRLTILMASAFREPVLRLGVQASDVMETFYKAIQNLNAPALVTCLRLGETPTETSS